MESRKVIAASPRRIDSGKLLVGFISALFFTASTWVSYARWANFQYRTFDLAYYVQALWQVIHGRFEVSVEHVPLLGNHVEPIVLLIAPLFAVFRHPLLLVAVQNAALAAMAPIGYSIAKRLGFDDRRAGLLSAALLLAPAAGYIALHEFHPEAFAAPLLLLLFHARLTNSLVRYWLFFVAVLACKENMALLLAAYAAVHCVIERQRGLTHLRRWYLWPMAFALIWFFVCIKFITPALNSGNIDYLALYDRLGGSPLDILGKAITQPLLIGRALWQSLGRGNLVWGLLFPFLFLPLLRPRWILSAAPVLLQHLLSWRSSEWMIYFHYAAPLLPIFWMALLEALATRRDGRASFLKSAPWLVIGACVLSQIWLGPAAGMAATTTEWSKRQSDRSRKDAFMATIPAQASVVAPLPYLSHLAMREKLYSLHYILKGLKTLSRESYQPPPPPDFVLIDYLDAATFDPGAGYYHPAMKAADGRIFPSSDRLLHEFLTRSPSMRVENSRDELTLLRKGDSVRDAQSMPPIPSGALLQIGSHTQLKGITKSADIISGRDDLFVQLIWNFEGGRDLFPWMLLRLANRQGNITMLTKGLCAPEAAQGTAVENWRITTVGGLPAAEYSVEALFLDNSRRAWYEATGGGDLESTFLSPPVRLGHITVSKSPSPR